MGVEGSIAQKHRVTALTTSLSYSLFCQSILCLGTFERDCTVRELLEGISAWASPACRLLEKQHAHSKVISVLPRPKDALHASGRLVADLPESPPEQRCLLAGHCTLSDAMKAAAIILNVFCTCSLALI